MPKYEYARVLCPVCGTEFHNQPMRSRNGKPPAPINQKPMVVCSSACNIERAKHQWVTGRNITKFLRSDGDDE